ncbi:Uncharacterized protein SCF082_LOCUS29987 [Durusdinium trenchii]|uniref:Uncharacterized protein n=1 Tax=Durusdinium trenchii TaxID=1381693 RepID=A0ABP0MXV6_9DINO
MRLKRLCERKPTGKLQVSEEVHNQWVSGNRDELTLALVRALKQCGFETDHKTRCAVRAQFEEEMVIIHEQTKEREEEIQGGWYTEERMATELKYSKMLN